MTCCPYKKQKFGGKTPCEDKGRDQGVASMSQKMSVIAIDLDGKPPGARRVAWNRFFLTALRRMWSCQS